MPALIVAVLARKGGAGKTTISYLLSRELARHGHRVLAVDLDAQAVNLSAAVGANTHAALPYTTLDLVEGHPCVPVVVLPERLDLIPSNQQQGSLLEPRLKELRDQVASIRPGERARSAFLAARLRPIRASYDFIIIDCPTARGEATSNALEAADLALSPIDFSNKLNVQSVTDLQEELLGVEKRPLVRYFGNKWADREWCSEAWEGARMLCGDDLLPIRIPHVAAVAKAFGDHKPIHVYASAAPAAAEAMWLLGQHVLEVAGASSRVAVG